MVSSATLLGVSVDSFGTRTAFETDARGFRVAHLMWTGAAFGLAHFVFGLGQFVATVARFSVTRPVHDGRLDSFELGPTL